MKFGPLEYIVLDNLGAGRMKDDSLNDTQNEECSCGRYHTASEFTCYSCGKLVPVKTVLREKITRPGGYCPMCDTVYDRPHECVSVGKNKSIGHPSVDNNVYATQIWNEAIEAAALKINELSPFEYLVGAVRSLKK